MIFKIFKVKYILKYLFIYLFFKKIILNIKRIKKYKRFNFKQFFFKKNF